MQPGRRKEETDNAASENFNNPTFFDGYKMLRENPDNANNLIEKPALFSLAPDLTGKAVLDLGCGYGENCAAFKRLGAVKVVGVDISEKMLVVAKSDFPDIEFIRADMNELSGITGEYDAVFSSLAVHYINDFESFVAGVGKVLKTGGCFIFSQEHPLSTAPKAGPGWTKDPEHFHYNLTDYSRGGERSTTWIVDGVIKYHRTFSDIVNALIQSGFAIEKMLEPLPSDDLIRRIPKYGKGLHKPDFLLVKAVKG